LAQGTASKNAGNTAAVPPAVSSTSSAAQDPGVNPSAAGTQSGDVRSGSVSESVKGGGEHGGSKNLSANTHPLAAAKANKQMRRRQQTEHAVQGQSIAPRTLGAQPTQSTGAGR
jgi:hypothetical protein